MEFFYFDFEYRYPDRRSEIVLLSWSTSKNTQPKTLDLRNGNGDRELRSIYETHREHIWVAFNAHADLRCLLAFGLDIRPLNVIDAMAEARMVTLTHGAFRNRVFKSGLLDVIRAFGIESTTTSEDKDQARNLILSKTEYSDDEWRLIERYGPTDIVPLPYILKTVWQIAKETAGIVLSLDDAIARGEYVKASTQLFVDTPGFPVDVERLNAIFSNREALLHGLAEEASAKYGPVFQWNSPRNDFSFNHQAFDDLVKSKRCQWEKTPSGKRKTSKDYFERMCKTYPYFTDLYRVRRTREALKSHDLRTLLDGTYIKPPDGSSYYRTFAQVTSRTSPLPARGFLLNLTPWMRTIIRPQPGKVFIGADWSQQEVAVAAVLSGDENLLRVYNSGDAYLGLGKMAGVIPPDGTKQTHKRERDNFKAIQLGLAYGKGLEALSEDIYANHFAEAGQPTISKSRAEEIASDIYDWHQQTFSVYWDWVADKLETARLDYHLSSVDGWMYFVDDDTRDTQLVNFPTQSGGAALMRKAIVNAWETEELDVVCSLHDAIYVNSTEENAVNDRELLVQCMDAACEEVLSGQVKIRVEAKTYTHDKPYWDPRGEQTFNWVKQRLGGEFI